LSNLTYQGKRLLGRVCQDFCMTDYSGCQSPGGITDCMQDPESMSSCLTMCDVEYDPSADPFSIGLTMCNPRSMDCFEGDADPGLENSCVSTVRGPRQVPLQVRLLLHVQDIQEVFDGFHMSPRR
jgi:hypothetical protein